MPVRHSKRTVASTKSSRSDPVLSEETEPVMTLVVRERENTDQPGNRYKRGQKQQRETSGFAIYLIETQSVSEIQ